MSSESDLVYAQLSENTERYDDMAKVRN